MGANLGSRHAMVAQGSPAARSPAPHGAGVTPNHHTDRLKACLEIEVGRLSTAVSRFNWACVISPFVTYEQRTRSSFFLFDTFTCKGLKRPSSRFFYGDWNA